MGQKRSYQRSQVKARRQMALSDLERDQAPWRQFAKLGGLNPLSAIQVLPLHTVRLEGSSPVEVLLLGVRDSLTDQLIPSREAPPESQEPTASTAAILSLPAVEDSARSMSQGVLQPVLSRPAPPPIHQPERRVERDPREAGMVAAAVEAALEP